MPKVNLLYSKRGRDDYLKNSLKSINSCDNIKDFDVVVYIGEDVKENINKVDFSIYKNLKIHHIYIPNLPQAQQDGDWFCRGHMFNKLLQQMRSDYDWFSVVDTDMIFSKDFLTRTAQIIASRKDKMIYVNNYGYTMQEAQDYQSILREQYDFDYLMSNLRLHRWSTPSHITVTKPLHDLLCDLLKMRTIFDSGALLPGGDFIGYGAEDELVVKILRNSKAEATALEKTWVHVWHPHGTNHTDETLEKNLALSVEATAEAQKRLRANNYFMRWRFKLPLFVLMPWRLRYTYSYLLNAASTSVNLLLARFKKPS